MNKFKLISAAALISAIIYSCTPSKPGEGITLSPEAGTTYKSGDAVMVKPHYGSETKPDSIVYLVDSVRMGSKKDSTGFSLKTDSLTLGLKIITAKIYKGGKPVELSTNIVLLPAKAPVEYTYKVIKTFPHDTGSYTEGLLYQDGYLYESAGTYGVSDLRKVDLNTGKVVHRTPKLDAKYFGEGISIIGDKIIQLTYKEKVGFVYDKNTFKLLGTFNNNVGVEGWGMCFDGKKLYMDDSTNRIWFLNKDNYHQIGYIDVYDAKGPVNEINELEYVDGKLYANVWQTNNIIVIDPQTGAVLETIDLTNLYPLAQRNANADVLNGIAWDAKGKRLFVTGKKWPHLYQVEFIPLPPKGGAK